MISTQQRDALAALNRSPVTTGDQGQRFLYTLGLALDVLLDKQNQAQQIHMPGRGDASQLPVLGTDRVLGQGLNETNAEFATRLSGAFDAWDHAGSRPAILSQVQAYLAPSAPLFTTQQPQFAIVGGNATYATWDTLYTTSPQGSEPSHVRITPTNWNWSGTYRPWWSWLILYFPSLPVTGLSGSSATLASAGGGSTLGHNVNGVWVPNAAGTPVNSPMVTVTGLAGLSTANIGMFLNLTNPASAGNIGLWQIVDVPSSSSCVIANAANVTPDANNGSISWAVRQFPIIGPGPSWGTVGAKFNGGNAIASQATEATVGQNVGGTWVPQGAIPVTTQSFGLNVSPSVIAGVRSLLRQWKSASTYYVHIIVAFDGASNFSPWGTQGVQNPTSAWASPGKNAAGVWVNSRTTTSPFDCFADGTGWYSQCSVHNLT